MARLIYHLSRNQRKGLSEGHTLQIAIPAPWHDFDSRLHYESRVANVAPILRDLRIDHVTVDPAMGVAASGGSPLGELIGPIIHNPESIGPVRSLRVIQVEVIVGILSRRPDSDQRPIQWPGRTEFYK